MVFALFVFGFLKEFCARLQNREMFFKPGRAQNSETGLKFDISRLCSQPFNCFSKAEWLFEINVMVYFKPSEWMRNWCIILEHAQKKEIQVLRSGVEPKTFRLLVQMLYHWAIGDSWELRPIYTVPHVQHSNPSSMKDICPMNLV